MTAPSSKYSYQHEGAGLVRASPIPEKGELAKFYSEKYFQSGQRYDLTYTDEDRAFIHSQITRKLGLLDRARGARDSFDAALEIGVGEGWTLAALKDRASSVVGVDFADFACKSHNPEVIDLLVLGEPLEILRGFHQKGRLFDLIWMDNVLEHARDPHELLSAAADTASDNAWLVLEVPFDYSPLQSMVLERGLIDRPFWEAAPEHLSYFTPQGLERVAMRAGWKTLRAMADFPIDLFLLHPGSNYVTDPSQGRPAHHARMMAEALLADQDLDATLDLYEALLGVGLGRQIISVLQRV